MKFSQRTVALSARILALRSAEFLMPRMPMAVGQNDVMEAMMNTDELLEKLLDHLSKPPPVQLPVTIDLWDTRHIAAYLKRSVDTVRDDIITLPTFPRPIRLPMRGAVRAQALYKARDVIAWAERHVSK